MKKTFLLLAIICVILTACGGQKNIPTVFPSVTPEPSLTATPILTSTSTKILPTQPPSTPTITPFPTYQNKQVVFDYFIGGNHANYVLFFDPPGYCCVITRLVLYDDGQMIIAGKAKTYQQKVLSSDEIKLFLSKLEILGFYSLESNQKHDPTDKLYDFGNNYQKISHGLKYCILVNTVKSRNICADESYMKFLIPKMKNILKYLDEYKPVGMTPYYPDRILLSIQADTVPATVMPWDKHFPSLEVSIPKISVWDNTNPVIYVDGEMAKKIYLFLRDTDDKETVFSQNGREYTVDIRVLFPHEKVTNAAYQ